MKNTTFKFQEKKNDKFILRSYKYNNIRYEY